MSIFLSCQLLLLLYVFFVGLELLFVNFRQDLVIPLTYSNVPESASQEHNHTWLLY